MKSQETRCAHGRRLVDSMLIRSASSLLVLAILVFVSYSIVIHQAKVASHDARLVNLCGRQRLLLAQTACEVERIYAKQRVTEAETRDLKQKLRELEETHTAFAFGDEDKRIPKPSNKVRRAYFEAPHELHNAMLAYIGTARELLQNASQGNFGVTEKLEHLRALASTETLPKTSAAGKESIACKHCTASNQGPDSALASIEWVVRTIQEESETPLAGLQRNATVLLITTLIALVTNFWMVTRPMMARVRDETTKLEETRAASEDRAARLEHAVRELNDLRHEDSRRATAMANIMSDLKRERTQLENSNHELEQFAYVASHDLKEPLRMVSNYTNLLETEYSDKLDDEAKKYIRYATGGAQRMSALIDDLLNYSRVGRTDSPNEPVDLNLIVRQVTCDLAARIEELDAQIHVTSNLPTISGNGIRLAQLFQNLICNALKFRHPDRCPQIDIECRWLGKYWEFSIADNGIGIEAECFERIFQVFQRLHTIDEYPGTGIGLAVCKKIIERHEGTIWVESELNEGTTFRFELPGKEVAPPPSVEELQACFP